MKVNKYAALLFVSLFMLSTLGFSEEGKKSADAKIYPEKVEADKNYDGIPDYAEYYKGDKIIRREADTDFDGKMDEWTTFDENGKPIKAERDTNKDGKPDAWIYYTDNESAAGARRN